MVFAIGFFDGCHRGHQKVMEAAFSLAQRTGAHPGIITFYPHPAAVLHPDRPVPLLQTEEEKEAFFAAVGFETAVILQPSEALLSMTAEAFLNRLTEACNLKGMAAGANFTFGAGGKGTAAFMKDALAKKGIAAEEIPLLRSSLLSGAPVSSTAVREAVQKGRMDEAEALLGRPYTMTGAIVHGERRGSTAVGFPTANLAVPEGKVLPEDGVYATRSRLGDRLIPSITNIGKNPTFDGRLRTIETFLLDFEGDIYGETLTLAWKGRIRGEVKFDGPEALSRQIASDIKTARAILESE